MSDMLNNVAKTIFLTFISVLLILLMPGCNNHATYNSETVKYNSAEYSPVEYPTNIFYYRYNGNSNDKFEDPEGIYPIESTKWKMIWNAGDLFCIKKQSNKANDYYANEDNYNWYVLIDKDEEISNPSHIDISSVDLNAFYDIETKEKNASVYFNEFEKLGDIIKISDDGIVRGTLSIGKYDGDWYWRSEVIDESREQDGTWPEYIQPLPESLNKIIKDIE